jgi:hypothetical protein
MRLLLIIVAASSLAVSAAPRKKAPPRGGGGGRDAVVVDAPPAMAKLLQSTLGARFAVSINRGDLSDAPTAKEVRTVTAPTKAVAIVMARAAGDAWTLTVLNGADGTPLETQVFRAAARKPLKPIPKNVAGAIILACATGQAPAAESAPKPVEEVVETKPAETPKKTEAVAAKAVTEKKPQPSESEKPASSSKESTSSSEPSVSAEAAEPSTASPHPALRVGVGFRGFGRALSWNGDPDQTLARYTLGFAPSVALEGTWYPGAHFTAGVGGNIGVAVSGDVAVGVASKQDTSRFGTRSERFRLSGAFRAPFGEVFSLEAVAGYSTQSFSIDPVAANDGSARPNIPSVNFSGPRGGLGVRLAKLGPISIDAMGGFTFLVSTGELGTDAYFKRARGFGVDATAGVAFELMPNLHARAGIDWTRYFLTLNPEEGARFTAPSAADQYLGGQISLQWVM